MLPEPVINILVGLFHEQSNVVKAVDIAVALAEHDKESGVRYCKKFLDGDYDEAIIKKFECMRVHYNYSGKLKELFIAQVESVTVAKH